MHRQPTCGFVIFREVSGQRLYLLLQYSETYWNFPKGRPEGNETEGQAARRELQEETGITNITVLPGFRSEYDYEPDLSAQRLYHTEPHKRAIFFLAQVADAAVTISHEHINFGWFTAAEARPHLSYPQSQRVLDEAESFLSGVGGV